MDNRKRPRPVIGNRRPTSGNVSQQTVNSPRQQQVINNQINQRRKVNKKYRNSNNLREPRRASQTARNPAYNGGEAVAQAKPANKKNRWIKILTTILVILVLLFLVVFSYARFSNLNPGLSGNIGLYNISSNAAAIASDYRIVNVAVFGIDGRDDVEGDRSDTIIIGTADFEHNKLKLTSLMRDTYVEMADEDYFDKLNAAYMLGGPMESLKTINLNFDTAITKYVVVDFSALVNVVNAVGGIDIDITSEDELYWLNQYLADVNNKVGTSDGNVPGTGMQHLTGSQALAYARIRYVGNGDFERTQRQRNVLSQVVGKISAMNPIQQISLVQQIMPYIQTNLSFSDFLKLGINFIFMSNKEIEQSRLPVDEYSSTGYLDGVSYVFPNTLVDNIKSWYQFIYNIDYTPSPTAQEISEEIENTWW